MLLSLAACSGETVRPFVETLDPPPLASRVTVERVELVQAAPVVLMDSEQGGVPGSGPVVGGRPGLLRVYVESEGRSDPVDVVLSWTLPGAPSEIRTLQGVVVRDVDPEALGDTFNFELSADEVQDGVTWSIGVYETEPELVRTGDHELPGARFPAPGRGEATLTTGPLDPLLDVYVVPYVYMADGTARQPVVTAERMQVLRDHIYKMYPVRDVRLTLLEPQSTDVLIQATDGLGDLLEDLAAWRVQAQIPAGAYVYGLVQPADSFEAFCPAGCTIGLSYLVSNPSADGLRASVGVGFEDRAADVMVHELGHAHGRRHAPCGNVGGPDPNYPHRDGGIGAPGWDVIDGVLVSARTYADFMGYCTPRWVSTYQLEALYAQSVAVASVQRLGPPMPMPMWIIAIRPDQAPRVRALADSVMQQGGELVQVEVLDADGAVLQTLEGSLHAFGHGGGGTLHVPDVGGAALRLADGSVLYRDDAP